jgi:hypothetical protein
MGPSPAYVCAPFRMPTFPLAACAVNPASKVHTVPGSHERRRDSGRQIQLGAISPSRQDCAVRAAERRARLVPARPFSRGSPLSGAGGFRGQLTSVGESAVTLRRPVNALSKHNTKRNWTLIGPRRLVGGSGTGTRKTPIRRLFVESGRQDLNLRPPGPQPGALPDCATPRGRSILGASTLQRPQHPQPGQRARRDDKVRRGLCKL